MISKTSLTGAFSTISVTLPVTALVVMIRIDHTDHGDVFYWEEPYYDRYRSVSGIIYPSGEASGNISYHHAGCDRDGLTWTAYVQ